MNNSKLGVRVQEWLRKKDGDCVCDECIATAVEESDQKAIMRVTARISSGSQMEFSRYRAKCAACGRVALTTRAKSSLAWA